MQEFIAIIINLLYFFGTGIMCAFIVNFNHKINLKRRIFIPIIFVLTFCIILFIVNKPWMYGIPLFAFFAGNYISYVILKQIFRKILKKNDN